MYLILVMLTLVLSGATCQEAFAQTVDEPPQIEPNIEDLSALLRSKEQSLGPRHPEVHKRMKDLADVYAERGSYEQATILLKRRIAIQEGVFGTNDSNVADAITDLTTLYWQHAELLIIELLSESREETTADTDDPRFSDSYDHVIGTDLFGQSLGTATKRLTLARRFCARITSIAPHLHCQTLYRLLSEGEILLARVASIEHNKPGRSKHEIKALRDLAYLFSLQQQYSDTELVLKRIATIADSTSDGQDDLATALELLGELFLVQGRYKEAETSFKSAISIIEKTFHPKYPERFLSSLSALTRAYELQGHYAEAEKVLKRRILERNKLDTSYPSVADVLRDLASFYISRERYSEAETLFKRCLVLRERNRAQVENNKHNKSPGASPDIKPLVDRTRWLGVLRALKDLAHVYTLQRRYAAADLMRKRILVLLEQTDDVIARGLLPFALYNLAKHSRAHHKWSQAVEYTYRAGKIVVAQSNLLAMLPETRPGPPARLFHQALRTGFMGRVVDDVMEIDREPLHHSIVQSSWSLARLSRPGARRLIDTAFRVAQSEAQNSTGDSLARMSARFVSEDKAFASLLREMTDLIGLDEITVKDEADRRFHPLSRGTPPGDHNSQRAAIRSRLAELAARLRLNFPKFTELLSPAALSIEEIQALLGHDEMFVFFFLRSPKEGFAWALGRESARWIRLGEDTAAIAASVRHLRCGLDREGEWVLPANGQRWFARNSACAALRPDGLASLDDPLPYDLAVAHQLYNTLFGRIDIAGKRLIVVLSGPLTALPLHVLVTTKPDAPYPSTNSGYAAVPWLETSHAITVLPSVASLKVLRQYARSSTAPNPYIGFGNPLLHGDLANHNDVRRAREARDKQSCPVGASRMSVAGRGLQVGIRRLSRGDFADIEAVRSLSPLPETANELCEVAHDLGAPSTEVYLGDRARKSILKDLNATGKLANARVVHFATHASLPEESSQILNAKAEPGLILTPPSAGTIGKALAADDGLLTASEIAQLNLNADWVVLSACNTAAAQRQSGDTLSGLARAFFYAGSRALLVSHWYVDSEAAVRLITKAFAELRIDPNIGRAVAMQRSMISFIHRGDRLAAHPAYWAPFVLVGEGTR